MNPLCCNVESKYVDLGPRLQYFYCGECKNEVDPNKDNSPSIEINPGGSFVYNYKIDSSGAVPDPNAGVGQQRAAAVVVPRPLDPTYEMMSIGPTPCTVFYGGQFRAHYFESALRYDAGLTCNCGETYKL